ncbi:MAG: 2-oxo acid dehydrogenase subunit E2 [Chloroflexota bacterium]|nr:2-oxo acid dehydrogenase subunit E2 [Chloroflexota bacterium]
MPEVNMPRLSDTMQEGTIARWLKQPGEQVKKDDILAEIETDKATMELVAYDAGVLERIIVQAGQTVPIGQAIAVIGSGEGNGAQKPEAAASAGDAPPDNTPQQAPEAAASTKDASPAEKTSDEAPQEAAPASPQEKAQAPASPQETGEPVSAPEEQHVEAGANGDQHFIKASPLARRIAEEHHIGLGQVQGSGPGGRIVRDDIEELIAPQSTGAPASPQETQPSTRPATSQQPAEEDTVAPLSRMQATIARRLTEAKQTIPHFYVSSEVDMTDTLALRQKLNEGAGEDGVKISVNDLIVKACALALEKFPEVNSSLRGEQLVRHAHIHIGIAVDVPAGLVVPVLRDANIKGVRSIARESRGLIEKARANKLTPGEMSGGTFSISNLGMMDVSEFVAVINPPEAAILAIASTRQRFVPVNDQPVVRSLMPMTLSADHRILYGATAARFLQEVKRLLQNPYNLLG